MTAPTVTAAEVRAVVHAKLEDMDVIGPLWDSMWTVTHEVIGGLYDEGDFRPSETSALDGLLEEVIDTSRSRWRGEFEDALVDALDRFAKGFPEAPVKPEDAA